jgi:parallel beta-helix repeat protein
VSEEIQSGAMPPKGKPRPPEKDVTALTDWRGRRARLSHFGAHGHRRPPATTATGSPSSTPPTNSGGNQSHGAFLGATGITVGGTAPGAGNVIAFNGGLGVYLRAGTGNALLGNSLFDNAGLGIDLGVTSNNANDGGTRNDADVGPNNFQNYPVIASAERSASGTTVRGTLNSTANATFPNVRRGVGPIVAEGGSGNEGFGPAPCRRGAAADNGQMGLTVFRARRG